MTRGAKIGENRFQCYMEQCVSNREDKILSIVMDIQREKLVFHSLTSMSHYVAKRFNESSHEQYGHITNTTILRNPKYKVILLRSYERHSKIVNENVASAHILESRLDNEKLKSSLSAARIEIKNLKRALSEKMDNCAYSDSNQNIAALDACYKIILLILESSNGVYVINDEGVVDKSNIYDNVIVARDLLEVSNIFNYQHYDYIGL